MMLAIINPIAVAAVALLATFCQATPPLSCAALRVSEGVCRDTPNGVVLADDAEMANYWAAIATEGEERFQRHFGQQPTPYAVLVGDKINPVSESGVSGAETVALQAELRAAGAVHILPWYSAEQRARLAPASRGEDARLDGARASGVNQDSAAAHELGHRWAVAAFWPDAGPALGSHYGGPGPDWFDEASAVLMEDEGLADGRREGFRRTMASPGGARPKPLADYFVDGHPVEALARGLLSDQLAARGLSGVDLGEAEPGAPNRRIIRREDLPPGAVARTRPPAELGGAGVTGQGQTFSVTTTTSALLDPADQATALMFYGQARVLADFLIEQSGDEMIFRRIGEQLAAGRTMDDWLAVEGEALHLGSSVAELDEIWRSWLTANYPATEA